MLDIFNFRSKKKRAPVKTAPLKLGFLNEDSPINELDFVIVPESAKVKNVSAEVIGKNETGLDEEIETIVESVNEVTHIQSPDVSNDQSDGAVSGMLNIFPPVEPADTFAPANPGFALEIKIPEEGTPAEIAAASDSSEVITTKPCDETGHPIEHEAVAAVSP
jgi:hypothetical protein